jgi:hypothetical protein
MVNEIDENVARWPADEIFYRFANAIMNSGRHYQFVPNSIILWSKLSNSCELLSHYRDLILLYLILYIETHHLNF